MKDPAPQEPLGPPEPSPRHSVDEQLVKLSTKMPTTSNQLLTLLKKAYQLGKQS